MLAKCQFPSLQREDEITAILIYEEEDKDGLQTLPDVAEVTDNCYSTLTTTN